MTGRAGRDAGFTLVEMLVSAAITLTLVGAVLTVLGSSQGLVQTQPEVVDIQQRLRVGVDALTHDLLMAGAGAYSGVHSGSLIGFFAPIRPLRQVATASMDAGIGVFETDAVTLIYVPSTASQTTIATALSSSSTSTSAVSVNTETGCPLGQEACGFSAGMSVAVFDASGAFDTFSVTNVTNQQLALQHAQQGTVSKPYRAGAKIVEVANRVYYLDRMTHQLMRSDGVSAVAPVLDNVVGLDFEYYGEPAPPALRHADVDQSVTYGPAPPAPGMPPSGPWAAGENCTFQVVEHQQVPRLASLGTGTGLVRLTASQLTDGPWCPDAANSNRFDADLLRVRKVRVTLRVQTPDASLRGSLTTGADALFAQAGTSTGGYRLVPDQSIRFDVSPRNLNLAR